MHRAVVVLVVVYQFFLSELYNHSIPAHTLPVRTAKPQSDAMHGNQRHDSVFFANKRWAATSD